jgi:hypothetical protein
MKASSFLVGAILTWSAAGSLFTAGRSRFNSEEHKLIGDRGMAAVVFPASVQFPAVLSFGPVAAGDYVARIESAKQLAAGFSTNDEHEFSASRAAVQDNCYATVPVNIYRQSDYNRHTWIPPLSEAPAHVLWIAAHAQRDAAHMFSFGELVGFYGDYRPVPYCEGARCYLTNVDVAEVKFVRAPLVAAKYCPAPLPAAEFLQHVGAGLVPPFGKLGNAVFNTAKRESDIWDAGWWGDEMLRIAKVNESHFSQTAVAWYVGMHRLALLYADSARTNPDYWVKALHYEANALHHFTDLFAFGHVVTNSDETSHAIIQAAGLDGHAVHQWMENVLVMGGAERGETGRVWLRAALPALADRAVPRNTLLATDPPLALALQKVADMTYHDSFNQAGATVRNLRGDQFTIYGDGDLHKLAGLDPGAIEAATGAVTASVQSLFDAFDALARGTADLAQLSADPAFFAALRYLPVYVVRDPHDYFTGRWLSYAAAINELSGARLPLPGWPECEVAFLSGAAVEASLLELIDKGISGEMLPWPEPSAHPCATFDGKVTRK